MTEQAMTSSNIRSDLIDTAVGFLKNPKVASEDLEKKRLFLQKKGLTDSEIDYAFKLVPQNEKKQEIIPSHHNPSFLRRILADLIIAGLIGYVYKLLRRWFQTKESIKIKELNDTIKALQKTVQDMQASITKLEQTSEQLHLNAYSSTTNKSALEEIKKEIESLKGLHLSRSQFPSIPPKLPAWQIEAAEKLRTRVSPTTVETITQTNSEDNKDDGDSIVVVSENEKKSDDETHLSLSPSSESSNEAH